MTRKHWFFSIVFASIATMIIMASVVLADTTYVVQSGDTLARIANRFNTTISTIADANNIVNPNYIYIGQVLTIPDGSDNGGDSTPTTIPVSQLTYTVQPGDTLSRIAARFGTTSAEIASLNGITNPNYIYVGQVLNLPGGSGGTPDPT
ncbi:MAG TPA: LysM domain-containing protein, partial [Anaerolineae bacterium]|nr:LysM domain-containing protein [Anaerolineae bacterium]